MITVYINDVATEVAAPQHLEGMLAALAHTPEQFAVALNNQFIPKSAYGRTPVQAGDRVELLVAMQGG